MKKILVVSAEYYPEISIGLKETLKKSLTNYDVEYFVVPGVFEIPSVISKYAETRLDKYEDYPIVYKKIYFKYNGKKVMTYTMVRKTKLVHPTDRYLNIIKQGYKDCRIKIKSLNIALQLLEHRQL